MNPERIHNGGFEMIFEFCGQFVWAGKVNQPPAKMIYCGRTCTVLVDVRFDLA